MLIAILKIHIKVISQLFKKFELSLKKHSLVKNWFQYYLYQNKILKGRVWEKPNIEEYILWGFHFSFLATLLSMWDLSPWPGIKPMLPALEGWSLNHWTAREVPWSGFWLYKCFQFMKIQQSAHLCTWTFLYVCYINISIKSMWSESHSVMSVSFWPCGLYSPRNCPGQNTGVGSHSLLQGIFPTQGANPGLRHCR